MRNIAFVICGFVTIFSCGKEQSITEVGLAGKWKLIESLADPGDGSGTFQPVENGRVIEFRSDGVILADEDLCGFSPESGEVRVVGTYTVADSVILPSDCGSSAFKINFYREGNNLILQYPCIEPCLQKYKKLD